MRLLVLLQAEQTVRAIEAGWADRNILDAVATKPRCCAVPDYSTFAVPDYSTVHPVHRSNDK
jgi:hypothetical protein